MSAMIGSGDAFLISTIARPASLVGTATRTMRQFASFRRAISFSVALTSRVSDLVIDCTTISAAPPMTTSPTRTGTDLRRALMASSQQIVICHQTDQSKQESEADVVDDLLTSGVDRPSPDQLQYQEGGAPTIQGGERQDVREPQAQAQERDHGDQRERARLGGPGRRLDDADRALEAPRAQQSPQRLIGRQLVDAPHDAHDGVARVAERPSRGLDRTGLPGMEGGMEAQDVTPRTRVEFGCHDQGQRLTITLNDDRRRRFFGGIERTSQVFELVDRATVDGANHITRF